MLASAIIVPYQSEQYQDSEGKAMLMVQAIGYDEYVSDLAIFELFTDSIFSDTVTAGT
jgi:hypothetical protein